MELTCTACSAKLAIPDNKIPQSGLFRVTCPKCHEKIQVSAKRAVPEAGTAAPRAAAPPLPAAGVPAPAAREAGASPPPPAEEEFIETTKRLAILCLVQPRDQSTAMNALAQLGYTVHVADQSAEALERLQQHRYELMLIDEEYGGSAGNNAVLTTLRPMPMALRRHICVGLVGPRLRTFDSLAAFSHSVNFVVASGDLPQLKSIVGQAMSVNNQFYRVFRQALRDAGKQS